MTLVAPTLQSFFTERLVKQRRASPRTIASYRDSLRLLVVFVHPGAPRRRAPLDWDDLDAETISAFLDHLEAERHNSPRIRNLRLTAIRSLFAYASLRHPEHAALIQRVLAIPAKRFDKPIVLFLTAAEVDSLVATPDPARWVGRRDRAMTTTTAAVLGVWMAERAGRRDEPLFPTRTWRGLSADAVERLVRKHASAEGWQRRPSGPRTLLLPTSRRSRFGGTPCPGGVPRPPRLDVDLPPDPANS